MEVKAYFTNIHNVIIKNLESAETQIVAAVAWFTDKDIFEILCQKARSGIQVSIVLIDDDINNGFGKLNFQKLKNFGAQVTMIPSGDYTTPTMHHKFCVIDRDTVITGSYNWSKKARNNDENITIIKGDESFSIKFLDVFDGLCNRAGKKAANSINAESVKRRLELIRNLILLDDHEDIEVQIKKLSSISNEFNLAAILENLNKGEYQTGLDLIKTYLNKFTALISIEDIEIPKLQFQLQILELRLESFSNEKVELERKIEVFNRRHNEVLGDLIQELLQLKADYAQLIAELETDIFEQERVQEQAEHAKSDYESYSRQHEQLKNEESLPQLNSDEEKELKNYYRRACNLCHPDKVTDDKKEEAHQVFISLLDAYKNNDIKRVNEIYKQLKTGLFKVTRSTSLSKIETLKAAVSEIKYKISKIMVELSTLQNSPSVKTLDFAGNTEQDWLVYFDTEKVIYSQEIEIIRKNIAKTMSEIVG